MRWVELTEKRRNPEVNVKKTTLEQLKQYEGKNVFVSFVTDVGIMSHQQKNDYGVNPNDRDEAGLRATGRLNNASGHKIGVNPKSTYNTPNGIYCYPVDYVISLYETSGSDFATQRPFLYVIEPKSTVLVTNQYSESNLNDDIEKIKAHYDIDEDAMRTIVNAGISDADETPASKLWSITRRVSMRLVNGWDGYNMNKWSAVFRMLGYGGFFDALGQGIIHPNEPLQCVFFSKNAFTVVETIHNRSIYMPRNPIGMLNVIKSGRATDADIANYLMTDNGELLLDILDKKYITSGVAEYIKHHMFESFYGLDIMMLTDLLLRTGNMTDDELKKSIDKTAVVSKNIGRLDQRYISDDVALYAFERVKRNNMFSAMNLNYFMDKGLLNDEELMRIIRRNPNVISHNLNVPESLYPELFTMPEAIVAFPDIAVKYVGDQIMADQSPYLHRDGKNFHLYGDMTMSAIANRYPMSVFSAFRNGFYDPPEKVWNNVFTGLSSSRSSRFNNNITEVLERFIDSDRMDLALWFTKYIDAYDVMSALRQKPNNMEKYINHLPKSFVAQLLDDNISKNLHGATVDMLKRKIAP